MFELKPISELFIRKRLSFCLLLLFFFFTRPLLVQLRQAGIPPTKANVFSTYLSRVKAQIGFWLWCTQQLSSFGTVPKHSIQFQFRWICLQANVHVVLAFSPVGDAFRTRAGPSIFWPAARKRRVLAVVISLFIPWYVPGCLVYDLTLQPSRRSHLCPGAYGFHQGLRMFPSLVNCCTIDWFAEWPAEVPLNWQPWHGSVPLLGSRQALYSVGKQQMTLEDLKLPNLEGLDLRTDTDTTGAAPRKIREEAAFQCLPEKGLKGLFRLWRHVTCCKATATLTLWVRLIFFRHSKNDDSYGRAHWCPNFEPYRAAYLLVPMVPGVLKVFSVVHQSVEKAAKKTMETVRPGIELHRSCRTASKCDPRSWDKGFDLEWNLWTWILWLIQSQISRAVPKSRSLVCLWAQPTRRAIYITPTSYLELISSFKKAGGFQIHQSSFQLGLPSQTGELGLVGRFWLWDEPGAQVRRRPPPKHVSPEVSHRCDVWESESQSKSWEPILWKNMWLCKQLSSLAAWGAEWCCVKLNSLFGSFWCPKDAVGTLKNRLQKGLDALGAAAYAVANMQTELEAKQPVLEETKIKAAWPCLALLGFFPFLSSVLVLFVLSVLVSSSPFPAPPNKINKLTNKIQKDKVKSSSTVSGNFSLIIPYPSVFLGLQHVANKFCFPSRLPIWWWSSPKTRPRSWPWMLFRDGRGSKKNQWIYSESS